MSRGTIAIFVTPFAASDPETASVPRYGTNARHRAWRSDQHGTAWQMPILFQSMSDCHAHRREYRWGHSRSSDACAHSKDTPMTAFPWNSWRFPVSRQAPVRSHSTIASYCKSSSPYPRPERWNTPCPPAFHPARTAQNKPRCCWQPRWADHNVFLLGKKRKKLFLGFPRCLGMVIKLNYFVLRK